MATIFDGALGVQQGRIQPVGFVPQDGSWVFVLGHDTPGALEWLTPGDNAEISQAAADLTGERLVYLRGRLRVPDGTPVGFSWELTFSVGGVDQMFAFMASTFSAENFELVDIAANISGIGVGDVAIKLAFSGPGTDPVFTEVAAAYIDLIEPVEPVADIVLINRIPHPNQTQIPINSTAMILTIAPLDGSGTDLSTIAITVKGVNAVVAGALQPGFAGSISNGVGPSSVDTFILLNLSPLTFSSEEVVSVTVYAETINSAILNTSYSFTIEDLTTPVVVSAMATSKNTIAVTYSEAVQQISALLAGDALAPSAYVIDRIETPAVALPVASVAPGSSASEVILTTFFEHSFGVEYQLTVTGVVDLFGNVVTPPDDTVTFTGFAPIVPSRRSFLLWNMIAEIHRTSDQTGDLFKLLSALQDPLDLLLCLIDRWADILDPDLAGSSFVSAMLFGLGNPFAFELTLADQRRLISVLIAIYQRKGTNVGMVDVIFFFLGIAVTVVPLNNVENTWILDESQLGVDSILFTDDLSTLYSFDVISPIALTDAEREAMLAIIDYMKPAHEHLLNLFEPGFDDPELFWVLGVGQLGEDSELQISI